MIKNGLCSLMHREIKRMRNEKRSFLSTESLKGMDVDSEDDSIINKAWCALRQKKEQYKLQQQIMLGI